EGLLRGFVLGPVQDRPPDQGDGQEHGQELRSYTHLGFLLYRFIGCLTTLFRHVDRGWASGEGARLGLRARRRLTDNTVTPAIGSSPYVFADTSAPTHKRCL